MKKIITLIALVLFCFNSFAQVPNKFSYQTVVRDSNKELVSNKLITVQISILQGSENGPAIYTELHKATTNTNGLTSFKIGEGELIHGVFSTIEWENGPFYVRSATDIHGGGNYSIIGVSELLSVPYALNARVAENSFSGNYEDLINKPVNISDFFNDAGYITDQNIIDGTFGPGNGVPAQVWSLFGNSNSDPTVDKLGTTDYTDLVIVTDNLDRLRIEANGDISIAESLEIGEDLTVKKNVYLNTEAGQTINDGNFTVANASSTSLTGTLDVDGATNLNSTLDVNNTAATTLTGTLDVDGATNLNSTLDVNNAAATNLTGTLDVDGATNLNSTLDVNNSAATNLTGSLDVDGVTNLNDDLNVNNASPTDLSGSLTVDGATDLNSTLSVDGVSTLNNTLNVNGSSSYIANFVNSTDANGISIKVAAGTPDSGNNFVTLKNSGGSTVGRIEGQTLAELQGSFNYIWWHEQEALETAFQLAMIVVDLVGVDDFDAAVVEGVEMVDIISNWAVVTVDWENKVGVSFSSGSGDYAEWLEKYNQNEAFSSGDIVGVKGGKISKNMAEADNYMVVSTSPIVLGNMPASGDEDRFEKVAFMGQVPVKVRGSVNIGDYIVASKLMDGFGKAVNPNEMTLSDYERIVGVAWSASQNNGVSMVNVAVGINTNDVVNEIKRQQDELTQVKSQLNAVLSYLSSKDPTFNPSLFDVQEIDIEETFIESEEITTQSNRKQVVSKLVTYLTENPDVLSSIMANARQILDEKETPTLFSQSTVTTAQFEIISTISTPSTTAASKSSTPTRSTTIIANWNAVSKASCSCHQM